MVNIAGRLSKLEAEARELRLDLKPCPECHFPDRSGSVPTCAALGELETCACCGREVNSANKSIWFVHPSGEIAPGAVVVLSMRPPTGGEDGRGPELYTPEDSNNGPVDGEPWVARHRLRCEDEPGWTAADGTPPIRYPAPEPHAYVAPPTLPYLDRL